MTTSVRPFPTPAEENDGTHQDREHTVLCIWHERPTFRRDARCDLCLADPS